MARWLHGSLAEQLARAAKVPTLFVPDKARGFVDPLRGELHVRHVLIPVDNTPKPAAAVGTIMGFARMLAGTDAEERLLHVGKTPAPKVPRDAKPGRPLPVAVRQGDVVADDHRGRQRMAGEPDRHADRGPSRIHGCVARLDHRTGRAPGALPVAGGAGLNAPRRFPLVPAQAGTQGGIT